MPVVLFTNVSAYRAVELMHATQGHMRYKMWKEPESEEGHTFRILCDKDVPLDDMGREASGDARGARPRPQARAAPRGPGSNPGRSTSTWWGGKKT